MKKRAFLWFYYSWLLNCNINTWVSIRVSNTNPDPEPAPPVPRTGTGSKMAFSHLFVWFKILYLRACSLQKVCIGTINNWSLDDIFQVLIFFLRRCRKLNGGVKTAVVEVEGSAKPGIKHHHILSVLVLRLLLWMWWLRNWKKLLNFSFDNALLLKGIHYR